MIDKRLLKGIDKRLSIKNVRFDRLVGGSGNRNSKTGTGNSKSRQKQGVIYLYPSLSFVTVDNSWMGAKVNDGIGDYTINGFQTNYYDGEIFSQEIEVI